jgi:hydrogenase maturation protein HypF
MVSRRRPNSHGINMPFRLLAYTHGMQRYRLFVRGIVQGVGFRPFLFSLASKHSLSGFVSNHSDGVLLEVQGERSALDAFVHTLRTAPPPLAVIDEVSLEETPTCAETAFRIMESVSHANSSTPISPDIATCDDCLRELLDPTDRRFRYPFINCTNCGPRFTIIRDIPYDRPNTTMAKFAMCEACAHEYHSPENRRFHAQPNACPVCGPRIWFERNGENLWGEAAVQATVKALDQGEIVAIKGIGGFHLAVDATREDAVARLRARKGRRHKPFALMARDLEAISRYAVLGNEQSALLLSHQRPIVLAPKRVASGLAASVAPGNPLVGFMLPYTPLHYLLLGDAPLVMTSGNLSEEPIVWRNEDARLRLSNIADAFLFHDRDIHVPCDDSLIAVVPCNDSLIGVIPCNDSPIGESSASELPIRRSRGYSPMPVKLAVERPTTLAVGADLKACFCLTRGHYAYMSQHIGDMENLETLEGFERALEHFQALFRAPPERVVCDAHPGYLSSRWARSYAQENGLPLLAVQHHHAHAAAIMAEYSLPEDAVILAFTFDGTGYGTDGGIWGGEVLKARYDGFERVAHLKYIPLPGGDSAIRHPARVALAHLWTAGIDWPGDLPCVKACTPVELRILRRQLEIGGHSVRSSSMGRLFDGVAALLGLRDKVTYEGQAAIDLEALCSQSKVDSGYPVIFGRSEFDVAPMWVALIRDWRAGVEPAVLAARFHLTVAEIILYYSRRQREDCGLETIALTGGVFQNIYLLRLARQLLTTDGFRVLAHRLVPPNDGGIALGQAVIHIPLHS